MANIQTLKNTLKKAVAGLSTDKKAELYYQDRKQYIKYSMQGEQQKAMELLKRNDNFYKEYGREDPNLFHQAHHKFLDWSHEYTHFQHYQGLIAEADREKDIFKQQLEVMEGLDLMLKNYKDFRDETSINNALEIVEIVKTRLSNQVKEYDEIIPELEQQLEENEYFKKHDYFQDVDPIGYKNISWKEYLTKRCNIGTNNGPVSTQEKVAHKTWLKQI